MTDPMSDTVPIRITKLDAARRQLDCAIELWFTGRDLVSAHTLAAAAHQIIHDINKKRGGSNLLFDSSLIKDEYRRDFVNMMKAPGNFFKHADTDPEGDIEHMPMNVLIFILMSVYGLSDHIKLTLSDRQFIFISWMIFHRPDYINPVFQDIFRELVPVQNFEKIRQLNKREFFEASLGARAEARARGLIP